MRDLVGISQHSADMNAVLRSHEMMLGRDLSIIETIPAGPTAGIVLIINENTELELPRGLKRWEPEHIPDLQLKVHSPDCLQITAEIENIHDGLINSAFKRFRNVRHTLAPSGSNEDTKKAKKLEQQASQERIRKAIFKQLCGNVDDKRSAALALLALSKKELEYCKNHEIELAKRIDITEIEVKELANVPEEALQDQMVDQAIGGVMKLLESGAYTAIEFMLTNIEAVTDHVWIKFGGKFFYMGTFKVKVPYNGENVQVTWVRRPPEQDPSNYPHPHVNSSGGCCLGNIAKAVPQYLKRGAYAALLSLLKEFLESYNSGNPYRRLDENWKAYKEPKLSLVFPDLKETEEDSANPDDLEDQDEDEEA